MPKKPSAPVPLAKTEEAEADQVLIGSQFSSIVWMIPPNLPFPVPHAANSRHRSRTRDR